MRFSPLLLTLASLEWALADPEHCGSFVHPLTLSGESTQIGEIVITDALNPWHQVNIDVSLNDGFDLTPDPNDDSAPTWITEVHATVCCPSPSTVPCVESTIPYSPGVTSASFTMNEPDCGFEFHEHEVVVSVDAKVEKMGGLPAINSVFPVPIRFKVFLDGGDDVGASYFDIQFTGSSPLSGLTFDGYCVDQDNNIAINQNYDGMAYSFQDIDGYDDTNIDYPQNMDLVAWLINNYRPGNTYTELSVTPSTYTLSSGTLQRAVWYLIGPTQGTGGLGAYEDDWAQFLRDEALGHDGYVPPNGGYIPIVLIPNDNRRQHQIIEATCDKLQVPCEPITVTGSAAAVAQCTPDAPPNMSGDPHLMTFDGEWFDYNGACDLVLLHVPNFGGGKDDLTVHVRTTIRYDYSYIEAAAIQIGEDKLEVRAWGQYSFNEVEGALLEPHLRLKKYKKVNDVSTIGGFPIVHTEESKKRHHFDIVLPDNQKIKISSMKDIVSVKLERATFEYFGDVEGVMGNHHGQLLARDGVTDLRDDINRLADEWQVRNDVDPILFATARLPQYPQKCVLPNNVDVKEARRLGQGISVDEAKSACAHVKKNPQAFKACVYDVTATNDLDQAGGY